MSKSKQHKMEATLLRMIIEDNDLYYENHLSIDSHLFALNTHKSIFGAFEKLRDLGEVIDIVSLSDNMQGDDTANLEAISGVISSHWYDASFEHVLGSLIESYKIEKLMSSLNQARAAVEKGENSQEIIDFLEHTISDLNLDQKAEVKHVSEVLPDIFENIELAKNSDGIVGVDTGFDKLNEHTGGWQKTDLVIIAGRTSQGKTSFSLSSALKSSLRSKSKWVFYSLEMSEIQLTTRLLSSISRINSKDILFGTVSDSEVDQLQYFSGELSNTNIMIDDCKSNEFKTIANSIRRLSMQGKLEVAVVDYLQLVSMKGAGSREQEVAKVARGFKNLAKEMDITILLLCQLSRPRSGESEKPRLSNLRDSGQIEEAADSVFFVYRPEHYGIREYDDGTSTEGKANIIGAKGRNIGLDEIELGFEKQYTNFTE